MQNKIKIENLTITNSQSKILVDAINLDIANNKITAIIGESGSGKTLTAHAIMGLIPKSLTIFQNSKIYYYTENQK